MKTALIMTACVLALPIASIAASPGQSDVVTIAGDGRVGVAEGAGLSASFVMPVGVSVAHDGSILIVDAGANAIYRYKDGMLAHVAGKIGPIADSVGSDGGSTDGFALAAQFRRPTAAIEDGAGRVFVADTGNHCIRVVDRGNVSIYAGTGAPGNTDGPAASATFTTPNALALDPDGNLLVSDYGVGIRKIDAQRNVTTMPTGASKSTLGVAAARMQGHELLAYTDTDAIHLAVDGKDKALPATMERMPSHEGMPVLHGWGIAILNENTVVVSDPMTSVIRLVRFPALPYTDIPASESVSGTIHEDTDYHGGFHDGTSSEALYNQPRGIALDDRGRLVIADTGNRRIRLLSGIDARETVLPDFSNYTAQKNASNIVIIGQSLLFNGVRYGDSIQATSQSVFDAASANGTLKGPVHVETIRADGIDFAAMRSIANEYVVDRGAIDVVVFVLTPITYAAVDDVLAEAKELAKNDIRTAVVVLPEYASLSPLELAYNGCGCVLDASSIRDARLDVRSLEFAYREAGVGTMSLLDPMIASERAAVRETLWDAGDTHYSPAGQRLIGRLVAEQFLRDHRLTSNAPASAALSAAAGRVCPNASALPPTPNNGSLDSIIDTAAAKPVTSMPTIASADPLVFGGWAVDGPHMQRARNVCVIVDGSTGVPGSGAQNGIRLDVVRALGRPELATTGFDLTLAPRTLSPGPHTIGIAEIEADGSVHTIGKLTNVVVR